MVIVLISFLVSSGGKRT